MHERVEGWVDPAAAFVRLFGAEPYAFWLDAGPGASRGTSRMGAAAGGSSVLLAVLAAPSGDAEVVRLDPRTGERRGEAGELFDILRAGRGRDRERSAGWIGWFGYEFGAAACGAPIALAETSAPDAAWMRAERTVCFDHAARTMTVHAGDDDEDRAWAAATARSLGALSAADAASGDEPDRARAGAAADLPLIWRHDDAAYLAMIGRCQERIAAGDAYQLCLTNTATIRGSIDPVRSYLALRRSGAARNGGLLRFGDWSLASASPEQFLLIDSDGRVQTRPIKGTRPRGGTAAEDRRLRDELAADEKESAENLMIVDLMRNDLGRVARLGTVAVDELLVVESYRQVHQLVSTVTARLGDGRDALDAVRACFPAGSMTGAPKLSAMRILAELERGPRGPYAGCFGRIGDDGSLELAMTIRSIVIGREVATIGAGGGITALSDPAFELAEVAVKARAMIAAVHGSIV